MMTNIRDLHKEHDWKGCHEEMVLNLDDKGCLIWVCPTCYPKYPERSKPQPLCPECGKELEHRSYMRDYKCKPCDSVYAPHLWDYVTLLSEKTIPTYEEVTESDIHYWNKSTELNSWTKKQYIEGAKKGEIKPDREKCVTCKDNFATCCGCIITQEEMDNPQLYHPIHPSLVSVCGSVINMDEVNQKNGIYLACGLVIDMSGFKIGFNKEASSAFAACGFITDMGSFKEKKEPEEVFTTCGAVIYMDRPLKSAQDVVMVCGDVIDVRKKKKIFTHS